MKSIKEIAQIVLTEFEEQPKNLKFYFLCNITDNCKILTEKEKKHFKKLILETFSCYDQKSLKYSGPVWNREEIEERKSFLNCIIRGEEFYEPKNHNTIYFSRENFKIAY